MDYYRSKYQSIVGKCESLYVYVLHDCSKKQLIEHIAEQQKILKRLNDGYKQKLYSSRYNLFQNKIEDEEMQKIVKYNHIFFIGETIETYELSKQNIKLLKSFKHKTIDFVYGNTYDLDFLNDLIFNEKPYHIFQLNNNFSYIQMTKHKKNIVKESKNTEIKSFIESCNCDDNYIIHGSNPKLKSYQDKNALFISSSILKDDQIFTMIDKIINDRLLIEFETDLSMLHNDKKMHRILFKKDIEEDCENYQIEKIYINNSINDELKKQISSINCKIIIINSTTLEKYGNIIGVTYY